MASFRPLSTRGQFVAGGVATGRGARDFLPLPRIVASAFRPVGVEPPAPQSAEEAGVTASAAEVAPTEGGSDAAGEARPVQVAPTYTPAELERMAELDAAIATATQTAAEFAQRERVRDEEHAQLRADLELQKEKARAASERVGQLAGEFVRLRAALLEEVRAHAGHLLLAGARRLAGESLRGESGLLESLVADTVSVLGAAAPSVRVNPEDVERIQAAFGSNARVVADTSIRGGCIVEGEGGLVDATVDSGVGSLLTEVQAWKRSA